MSFSTVYALGDSLSDSGAFFKATQTLSGIGIPLEALGYAGRFSDGPVFVEVAADLLGAALAPDLPATLGGLTPFDPFDGLDPGFAYGSARATGERTVEDILTEAAATAPELAPLLALLPDEALGFDVSLGGQVERLQATLAAAPPPPGSLATIFIGLNDFQTLDASDPFAALFEGPALVVEILAETEAAARAAAAGGVETIALFTYPPASFLPPIPGAPPPDPLAEAFLDGLFALHELGLTALTLELRSEGVDARLVDYGAMAAAVDADPGGFGLATLDVVSVLGTGGLDGLPNPASFGFDPDSLGFFDLVHPSAALHGVFGAFTARTLQADQTLFLGDPSPPLLFGGREQLIVGAGDVDVVFLGGGGDAAFGGAAEDFLYGGSGADLLAGGGAGDALFGGSFGDLLAGGEGDDTMRGLKGDDVLIVGQGADDARGGRIQHEQRVEAAAAAQDGAVGAGEQIEDEHVVVAPAAGVVGALPHD
ncbi:MAG: SGNH/GDSL hydrolase family protein, partial [Pseudomonadota bacterium]